MEKESKEWGNKAQRSTLKALRDIFPQVDIRILKGTVLDHEDDIDAAVEFIVTEVLELPIGRKVDQSLLKEHIPDTATASSGGSLSESRVKEQSRGFFIDNHSIQMNARNPKDSQLVEMTGVNLTESDLFDLSVKSLDNNQSPGDLLTHGYAATLSDLSVESAKVEVETLTGVESVPSFDVFRSPYIVMSESLTESEPDGMAHCEPPVHYLGDDPVHTETLLAPAVSNQLEVPSCVEVTEESVHLGESLYGSVLDVGVDAEYTPADVGASTWEDSWSDEKNLSEKHVNSMGSRWAYDSDDDDSDMQESKSSLLAVPSGQFDTISRYTDEGSRLMESSILEETLDGLFNSSSDNLISGSSQLLTVDVLDDMMNDAKSDKEALATAIEEMRAMRYTVEQAEAAAQQSKEAAMNGGLDVLAKVDEMRLMLIRAREANEMHAGEVYGEKAVLGTESQELQRRLAQLKAEKDKAFAAVNEMRATLQGRIDRANEEREAAEAEKRLKEESARNLLAIEEELMAKVAQESRDLDAEEEACTKLREFLIDRGSIVDSLQGEVAIICEDVDVLKKQLDDGVLTGGSSFVQMMSLCSSRHSCVSSSEGEGSLKVGSGGSSHFGRLSHSGSSYQSATRAGELEGHVEDLSASQVVEEVAKMTLFEGDADQAFESRKSAPFQHNADSVDDEGWNLLEISSAKSNGSSVSSPSFVKRSRSEAFEF